MRLSVESLAVGYGHKKVLEDISFHADSGEIVALIGPNGSGKSTLIKTLCNILPKISGRILIDDRNVEEIDITDLAKLIAYVPQSANVAVYTSVIDMVLLGRRPYVTWSYREKDIEYAVQAMERMKVDKYSDRNVSDLSGGQRQRAFIARCLAQCPSFYIFDEPTSALDLKHQMNTMISMSKIVHREGACMIIALHDINLALKYCDRVVILKDKGIYSTGTPLETITSESIRDVYGVDAKIADTPDGRYILPVAPCDTDAGGD